MKESQIIGITGAFGSGKSTAAEFFASEGYVHITLSQFLEEEARRRDLPVIRSTLQDIGNELRKKHGTDFLAKKALEYIHEKGIKNAVIDGIRNIGEIDALLKHDNFLLIGIVSNRLLRFERLKNIEKREKLTQELFDKLDFRDLGLGEERSGLQVALCTALADIFVVNNGTKEEFHKRLEEIL